MKSFGRLLCMIAPMTLMACGGAEEPPVTTSDIGPDGIRDLRVEVPEPDATHIDFVGGEWVVQPGEDKMICTHFRYDGEDTAFSNLEQFQGKFGHHGVLLASKQPLPPGTVEDCSLPEDMAKYDGYTLGDTELPAGRGVFLPKGKAMVLQSHYLNTGSVPIRIRDIVRLKEMPIAEVQTWASMYITNLLNFEIPPHSEKSVTFDCPVGADMSLLLIIGHMHEWGRSFKFEYGETVDSLAPIYTIDTWTPDFRDNAPVTLHTTDPFSVKKGAIFRTSCTWKNDLDKPLSFPSEMCNGVGYAEGPKDPVVCSLEKLP